ncbi:hypothetical protein O7N79_004338 [Salmonella enterica]|nr:hypothetical protein [Salmonella enterica]
MKIVFLVTQCQYTISGFLELMHVNKNSSDTRVIQVGTPYEIAGYLSKFNGDGMNSVIVVDMFERTLKEVINRIYFIWNLRRLMSDDIIKSIPCIILGGSDRLFPASFVCVSKNTSIKQLRNIIRMMFNKGESNFKKKHSPRRPLCKTQRKIIDETMKGGATKDIARKMNLDIKRVFYNRNRIMRELGLRNRHELALLNLNSLL